MNVCARRVFLVASLCFFALLPCLSFAQKTIHVPADVPDIQTAIFAAQNGDTVLVSPGLYFGSITFQGRNITVMSSDGAAVTTVDSGFQPSAQFFNNENNGAVLKGFTFVNGSGVQILSASPIIEDNVITNNQGCQAGGIMVSNGSPIIRGNTISNNRQFCAGAPAAGGISVDGQGSVQILNNTIVGNQAAPGVPAGGIFTDAFGTTTIIGNKIQNNVTDAAGGGIYANGSDVIIAGNLITGNSASMGGGIQIAPGSNAILVNNTVALNQALQGAQLALDGMAGTVNLFNNIFYDLTGNGAIFCSMAGFTGFPPAQNNDTISFAGNPAGPLAAAYTGSCSDPTGFNGNVQAEPQFTNPINGDFHLLAASPLIDAGNSAAPDLPAQDLDGNPRIAAGSNLCLPFIDIGTYEIVFNSVGSASMGPSSLAFGEALIGVPSFFTQPVTLIGIQGCTQITSITTSSDYQQTSNCSVLRAGDSCTIQVTFAPKIAGVRAGALKVNLLSPAAALTAELSGTGLNAATVTPTDLRFGIQAIQTTQFQSVNVSSTSGQQLVVSSVSITGDFQQFSNCSQFSSNVCFISVQFTPTLAGLRTGVLTVVSNLGTFAVPLSGDGAAPTPSLSPTSLSFPTQTVGTASTPQLITLTNNGTAEMVWNSVISTPDFQVSPGNCDPFLLPGASCTFSVVFAPTIIAPIAGSMEIDTNGGAATASLTGIGTAPIASLSPQVLTFANQPLNTSSVPQTITVTNISGAPLQLASLSAPDNFLAASGCPAVLAANASCGIDVTFGPTSSGPYGGFLTLGTTLGPVTAALTVGRPRTFHVPSEVQFINQAVQLAQDGDTVLVAPGTYFEQINFQGKAVTIASSGGAAVTTLDGGGIQTPVFLFQNEGPGSVLRGFTVTHGVFAGVEAIGASPTIEDNIITENNGCLGGGLQLQTSSAIVKGNTISNNTIGMNCGGGDGAGIWIGQGGNVQVLNNIITGNQITSNGFGAGIAVSAAFATITSNTIQNNSTNFGSGGGIALIGGGSANTIQNLITGNSASVAGGGIMVSAGSFPSPQLINNTIADNFAPSGSGLFVDGGNAAFANNLIIDSSGSSAIGCSFTLSGNFSFNDVFSFPGGVAYGAACGNLTSIALNISQDPQFVNSAAGNYRLQSSSPAIDAGTNFPGNSVPPMLPDRDLDGNGRILPGNSASCNGIADLGAYEFATGANGTPGLLPASWDFGSGQVGFSGAQFVFNLTAQGCVAIGSIKTTGDFQQTNTCNNAVSSFRGCSVSVNFNPQHPGPRTGSLIVDYGTSALPVTVSLTGEGISNPPLASPSSLNFAPQAVGTSSAVQQVSIPQTSVPLTVNAIWISGDFSQTNSCGPKTVQTGGGCVINVVFTPTGANSGQGSLSVNTNLGVVVVPLNGVVDSGPVATFSQSPLAFGDQPVGTSKELDVTLSNTGTAPLSFGVGLGPDFSQTNNCPQPLPAGNSCNFRVVFNPTIAGTFNESLTLSGNSNPPATPVALTGTGIGPLPSFTPTSLTFATQLAGTTSAPQSVSLSNTGNAALTISGMAINGDFSETDDCGTLLAVGASCTVNVVFKPTANGTRNGSVTLLSNFNGLPTIRLTGTGQAVQVSVSPASLTFLPVFVGTSSAAQSVTYTNTGSLPISITGLSATGDFAQINTCGTTLAVGATCTASVTFTPTARGARTGSLTIAGNFTGPAPVVNLSGTGQVSEGTVSPGTLSFADQQVGTTSARQNLTLTNTGDGAFSIFSITASGDFTVSNGCPSTLAVGSSCQIGVTFAPTALGPRTGTVLFTTTASINGVGLTGNGIGPNPVFSSTSLSFGPQYVGVASAAQSVTLSNTGTMTLTISSFNLNADYSQTNNCGASLAPGASCIVNVNFRPAGLGIRTGTLFVVGNVFGTPPPPVNLSGTGENIQVTASPAALTFAAAPLNTASAAQTVTFTNSGDLAIAITGLTINGDFSQTNTCQSPLAVGATCTVNVIFTPTVRGARSGSLSFTSNAPGTAPVVALNGTGQAILATASPASLAFAAAPLNNTSAAQAVMFTNAGDLPIAITGPVISGDFAQTNTCGTSLAVGASCTVNVTFTPTARGSRTGAVTLQGNFTSPAPVITLAGTGQAFVASLTPASFNFGDEPVNTATNPQIFTYTNTGDLPLSISGIAVAPDFSQTNTCPAILAVGASCTINATFVPRMIGTQTASLNVSADVSSSVNLTGNGVMPQATLSPASLTFGHQRVGTVSAAQLVSVTNTGVYAFFINQVSAPGGYQITNNCPGLVSPGASCSLSIVFAPTSAQPGVGSLTIGGDFTATPSSVSLSGNADASTGTLSPTALSFANQVVGSASASQTVMLSSTGNVPINLSGIQTTGDFSQTNNCGTSVAAGTNCIITVTFTPTAHGTRSGSLSVSGDFTGAAPSATLSGNGTTPTASWSPASLSFVSQLVGTNSSAQVVTLTNSGDGPLTIFGINATGDFTQTNTCGGALAVGGSCTVNVTFTPSTAGSRSGTLSLNSNSSAAVSPITLSGTGIAPSAVLSPASLGFANQTVSTTSAAQTATLTNSGTAALSISSINATGDFAQTNTCGTSLAAGTSCTINITFSPTATGSRTGSLSISDNFSGGSPQTGSLSGTGTDYSVSASPTSVTISAGQIASYTVTVASAGPSFGSPVSLSCSGLPAASSCTFSPASVTPGSTPVSSALKLTTTARHKQAGTPAGSYTVTITGTSGNVQHATTIHLTVN